MNVLTSQSEKRPKIFSAVVSMALVAVIGLVDYLTGYAIFFSAFYLVPVALAAWFAGGTLGVVISVLCVVVSLAGDYRPARIIPTCWCRFGTAPSRWRSM